MEKQKTAMQIMIQFIEDKINEWHLTNQDVEDSGIGDIKKKANDLLEVEKEQLIEAYNHNNDFVNGDKLYNQTFTDKP